MGLHIQGIWAYTLQVTPTAKRNSYRVAILVGRLPRVACFARNPGLGNRNSYRVARGAHRLRGDNHTWLLVCISSTTTKLCITLGGRIINDELRSASSSNSVGVAISRRRYHGRNSSLCSSIYMTLPIDNKVISFCTGFSRTFFIANGGFLYLRLFSLPPGRRGWGWRRISESSLSRYLPTHTDA